MERMGVGGLACRLWCIVLVCSGRHLLADHHSLPFPWTLSLHRRWCPSAFHCPVSSLSLLRLSFPLYFPFLSHGLSLQEGGGGANEMERMDLEESQTETTTKA